MVRDAIEAGSLLMKTIRVFVSSTGDVQKERVLADRAIRSVAGEFNVPVSVAFSNFQRLAEENGESKTESENHADVGPLSLFFGISEVPIGRGMPGTDPEHGGI